ncbi:molybdopterin guanine dinucleotide synthesis [Pseudotabrizicola algicola]|uniref:Molybdopterin guanine dinucleotide synthesis n=1 Tax=Pseudotabrizicola algicola TaxID=2709381 RepID=A0A6B3RJM1_9RHOB|nr:molybdopterin guanine dinucleotide synthesis [Pseudotabrizicola algicola]NEX46190.1 molybdopterin guanine dinucleotide synthesis [Pseudotabrizicola algicola]
MIFDRIAILDWSAAKGPKRGKDSIWLATATAAGCRAQNIPTRAEAEAALADLVTDSLQRRQTLLIGADFAFGAPRGFIPQLTGQKTALSWWAWLAERMTDTAGNISNYRQIAAQMNSVFPEGGPFWGNGERADTPGLPRFKPPLPPGLAQHRATDLAARGPGSAPKPVWQLAGAGAVGAQVLTGLPMLHRLRLRFGASLSVWPFETATTPVVLAEVYPSLLASAVREKAAAGMVPDEAQVILLASALFALAPARRAALFSVPQPDPEEGWILGAGHARLLQEALG